MVYFPEKTVASFYSAYMPGYFIYCRKSTEAEDRQVLSIDSQVNEMREIAAKLKIPVADVLTESKSAKEPGRPVFNQMMKRLYRGEAAGVICWKLDRLARNPVDGGSVIWAIKQHGIKVITPAQTFAREDDNVILMYIEFGMAQKYVDDLSKNVKRGLKAKIENGWFPGLAPVGYLNHKVRVTGENTLVKDPERFPLVRKMWDLMLSGLYTPAEILRIANQDWKFRTRQSRKTGGKAIPRAVIYRMFTQPFYYGQFEYPQGSGQFYQGKHEPMITPAEYDRVQMLLGRKGNPRPQSRRDAIGRETCRRWQKPLPAQRSEGSERPWRAPERGRQGSGSGRTLRSLRHAQQSQCQGAEVKRCDGANDGRCRYAPCRTRCEWRWQEV